MNKKNKDHVVNFAVFESAVDEVEQELDMPSPEHEEGSEEEGAGTYPDAGYEETDPRPNAVNRPTGGVTDPGFNSADTKVMKIAGELEIAAHTGDDALSREALGKWFEVVNSTHGNIKSLNLSPGTISKLTKAVQAIPNHSEIIAEITGKFGAKPKAAYNKPTAVPELA